MGTPDGPRSVLPISGARGGHGAPRHVPSALPSLSPYLSGALVSAVQSEPGAGWWYSWSDRPEFTS